MKQFILNINFIFLVKISQVLFLIIKNLVSKKISKNYLIYIIQYNLYLYYEIINKV